MARRRRRDRARRLSLNQVLPNLITLGAICAGLTAIRFAIAGRFNEAIALILLAAFLDWSDGRMARLLRSESAIGAELDSLADFLNFGVAVGMLIYLSTLQGQSNLGWIAVLVYVICCVMRLARFNVGSRLAEPGAYVGFVGVPSPAGAILALLPLALNRGLTTFPDVPAFLSSAWLIAVGLLMVSRIPTPSLKLLRVRSDQLPYLVILLVAGTAILFTWPWHALIAMDVAYLLTIGWAVWRRPRTDVKEAVEDES